MIRATPLCPATRPCQLASVPIPTDERRPIPVMTTRYRPGHGFTVKEVLDEIERQLGRKPSRTFSARRDGDPSVLVADSRKAMEELSWKPAHSDLQTIIQTALRWHTSRR
jgi:nucleoside-diphosphate-sugar epimerase